MLLLHMMVAMPMPAWRRGRGRWWGKSEEEDDGQAQQAPAAMEQDALAPAMLRAPATSQLRIGDRIDSTLALLLHSIASVCSALLGFGIFMVRMPFPLSSLRSAPESG
jgi:hypothetical protein